MRNDKEPCKHVYPSGEVCGDCSCEGHEEMSAPVAPQEEKGSSTADSEPWITDVLQEEPVVKEEKVDDCQHECGDESWHETCKCVKCGATYPNKEREVHPVSAPVAPDARQPMTAREWLKQRGINWKALHTTWAVEPGTKYADGDYLGPDEMMEEYAAYRAGLSQLPVVTVSHGAPPQASPPSWISELAPTAEPGDVRREPKDFFTWWNENWPDLCPTQIAQAAWDAAYRLAREEQSIR